MPSSAAASPKDHSNDSSRPPPPPPPPPSRARSSFDLEPNPFEQSFSHSSRSDGTPDNANADRTDQKPPAPDPAAAAKPKPVAADDAPKPVLPSLAALSSPSDGTYGWSDLAGSLRSGPLSPAMLQGPQQPQQSQNSRLPFDPNGLIRTGLTPSTGLTPLVGGPVSFPPPSPNTAAFLAMVTNSTSASQLASTAPATITPNTLSAITGIPNPAPSQPQPAVAPGATTTTTSTSAPAAAPAAAPSVPMASYSYGPVSAQQANGAGSYTPANATNAATAAANGLFLLSQAHQELAKREEQARASAQPAENPPKRGSKRKPADAAAAAPPEPTNARTSANKRSRPQRRRGKASPGSGDDEEDSLEEDEIRREENERRTQQVNGPKKPETEEEKRRNFLERNRQAALKCRQRKKAWLAQLQAKVEFLTNENERLTTALVSSREEISRLNALLGAGGAPPSQNGVASQPVSVAVSLPGGAKNASAPAVVSNGRGYGY